jgi:AP-4 complex subunit epsilon-1
MSDASFFLSYLAIFSIQIFLLAGDLVKPEAAHTLMQLIAEGTGEDDDADEQLRKDAVENYVSLLLDDTSIATGGGALLPDILVQTMSWTLGEYGYLSERLPQTELMTRLAADIAHRPFHDPCTRGFVVASVVKLVAQTGTCPAAVSSLLALYGQSRNLDLQQRCLEFSALLHTPEVMVNVLPMDASCEDLGVDESLSFLDSYVEAAVARGAPRYCPPPEHAEVLALAEGREVKEPGLKLTPYAKPEKPSPATSMPGGAGGGNLLAGLSLNPASSSSGGAGGGGGLGPQKPAAGPGPGSRQGLRPVAQVWSRQGAVVGSKGPAASSGTSPAMAPSPLAQTPVSSGSSQEAIEGQAAPDVESRRANGGGSRQEAAAPRELTEKEKLAQALFGGLGASSSPGAGRAPWGVGGSGGGGGAAKTSAASRTARQGGQQQQQPPPAASSGGGVDLLDMDGTGDNGTLRTSRASPPAAPVPSSPPVSTKLSAAATPSLLDFGDEEVVSKPTPTPTPTFPTTSSSSSPSLSSSIPAQVDPFAALSGVTPQSLQLSLPGGAHFSHDGRGLQPLAINTQDFGARWTQMRFQAPAQGTQTPIRTLEALAAALQQEVGLHVVESIPRTAEVIAAGRLGPDGGAVLVHAKLHAQSGSADCLIKCNDNVLAQHLSQHLAKTLRR